MLDLLKYIKPYRKQAVIAPIFKMFEAILEIMIPTIMVLITDKGIKSGDNHYILAVGALMLLMAVLGVAASFTCQYNSAIVSQGFGTLLRNAMFDKIGTFSNKELDKIGTSSLINRITNDVNQLQVAVAMLLRLAIRVPFLCIGGVIMAMFLDIKLSTVMLLSLPLFAFAIYIIMNKTLPLYKLVQSKLDKIALVLRENLSGVRMIRAFAKVDYEKARFQSNNEELATTSIGVGKISALMNPTTNIIMNLSVIAILWFGGIRVNSGGMTQGQIIAFINYTTLVLSALIVVANLVILFTKAAASAARVNEILNTVLELKDSEEVVDKSDKLEDSPIISFKDVSFKYNDSPEYALKNINFDIKKGETVGIIGGTGSGKTTLINLIPRFYDVTEGKLEFQGVDVRYHEQKRLRSKIGIVAQKAVLFTGSIAENIKWGKLEATKEEIISAAEISQSASFIEKLTDGYETKIEQGGVNFSGGQKQRLSIARALVRKPELLILDDSSSALDYATDAALRKGIRLHKNEMTVIMVTQRVSTIIDADKIIVLDDGEMIEMGKHEELLESCEIYKEIYISQLEK